MAINGPGNSEHKPILFKDAFDVDSSVDSDHEPETTKKDADIVDPGQISPEMADLPEMVIAENMA